ncbi:hypothetical protein GLOTRDRAFT_114681 [Gloeophyllum trabeum ATCC 11539]|uniref:Voltage-gated hydrogen channel 1 n=1 Tax=Gloeophyllum trabeum (strain ATCC 11539 / FP-39264 / Madison 617) TaxID=670483 RepID=S7QG97_GLOTA|nr:uncharacterized protein GLOTRDRAFT_114681 [Gloeophyllum trabeum ATCC 11539]EPQ58213.1 hypothetical protein GLOTRDRAFT_114681 [Gloeophyllum trabeum ATCC 11539]
MSEQQPLLSSQYEPDVESGDVVRDDRREKPSDWRARLGEFLESPAFHKAIAIDATCVLADLVYSFLSPGCIPPEGPDAPLWLDVLSHISLAITTFFLIEIPLALCAFGLKYYYPLTGVTHSTLHLFDAIVIIVTFVLEVVLRGRERELAGLLIILRLWRLVKLVGGIAVGAGEIQEDTVKDLQETRSRLNEALTTLADLRAENATLRARIASLESRTESE